MKILALTSNLYNVSACKAERAMFDAHLGNYHIGKYLKFFYFPSSADILIFFFI